MIQKASNGPYNAFVLNLIRTVNQSSLVVAVSIVRYMLHFLPHEISKELQLLRYRCTFFLNERMIPIAHCFDFDLATLQQPSFEVLISDVHACEGAMACIKVKGLHTLPYRVDRIRCKWNHLRMFRARFKAIYQRRLTFGIDHMKLYVV